MGTLYVVSSNAVAHAGSGASKTILQLATTSTVRAKIVEWGVTFNGTSSAATPCTVLLQRQTSAGTGGVAISTNYGPNGIDEQMPAGASTALQGIWATTEPTAGAILCPPFVPPTSGFVIQYPLGQEPWLKVSGWLGIVVNAAAAVNVNAWMKYEE